MRSRIVLPVTLFSFTLLGAEAQAQCSTSSHLSSPAPKPNRELGYAVDVEGSIAVVGAPANASSTARGRAWVFERDPLEPTRWVSQKKLLSSDGGASDRFGGAVAVSGDTIAVGASRQLGNSGAVYVFERDAGGPGQWGEVQAIPHAEPGGSFERFGFDVALAGNTLLVGAPGFRISGAFDTGRAYVYERPSSGSPFALTKSLDEGAGGDAEFGHGLALDGDTAMARYRDIGTVHTYIRVYERDLGGPGAWGMSQQLEASDPGPAGIDAFGTAISMSGDLAAIGAFYDSFSTAFSPYSGSAYVFERQGSAWSETRKLFAPTPVSLGYFGHGVGAADDRVVIGSPFEQVDGARTGAAYVYARDEGGAGNWGLAATLLSEDPNADDQLGHAVAIDGGLVFAGAIGDDDPQASSGSVEIYDFGPAISQPYVSYCTAGTSAGGCNALLSACGVASASAASGFRVTATGVEGGKDGLYFFGVNGRQSTAWGNGTSYQCVVPPVRRGALLEGAGTSGSCDGGFTYDLNAHWSAKPAQNPGVGAVVDTQLWFRDPQNSSNQTTSLSNAIEVTVEP